MLLIKPVLYLYTGKLWLKGAFISHTAVATPYNLCKWSNHWDFQVYDIMNKNLVAGPVGYQGKSVSLLL